MRNLMAVGLEQLCRAQWTALQNSFKAHHSHIQTHDLALMNWTDFTADAKSATHLFLVIGEPIVPLCSDVRKIFNVLQTSGLHPKIAVLFLSKEAAEKFRWIVDENSATLVCATTPITKAAIGASQHSILLENWTAKDLDRIAEIFVGSSNRRLKAA